MKGKLYLLRGSFCWFAILFVHSLLFCQQVGKSIPYAACPEGAIGFLEFRPADYGSQKHPLIIFLHGYGERGNGSASQVGSVAVNGIPNLCANGASMRFTVGGQTSSFVVLSPQLSTWYGYWPTFYITEMIKYAKANLSIDPNRIYITGLSLGGGATWRAITEAGTENYDFSFDAGIAAAAPVCGTQEENDGYFCRTIGDNHLPVWAFHSMDDGTVGVGTTQHAEILAGICGVSPAMKFTYYQSGNHGGAWVNAYDTGHITRTVSGGGSFTANPNLYEWFLSHTRSAAPTYTAPVASAGSSQTISLPTNTITLNGSGTGTNGASIVSYSWAKTSGPSAGAISLPLLNTTFVTGLVQGTYVFTLTITDNHGLSNSSSVTITVNPLPNQLPVANAGTNTAIILPTNSATLNGNASSDPDGSISNYLWTKTSGPSTFSINNANAASTTVNNLVQGIYIFTLKVTDNAGGTATSTVTVTVNAAPNQLPNANAGSNSAITLPVNNIILNGTASADPDGTINSYRWTKTSGPAAFAITDATAASTTVNNLVQGTYIFSLEVTDNAGATATAVVTVTVNAAALPSNQSPVANAGPGATIVLPINATTLDGSGSVDPDGTISTYLWTKISGPATFTIASPSMAITALTNLVQGTYVFALQVTDDAGATASSTVTITVNAPANQLPVSNPGNNVSITLPVNNTILDGTASKDPDGSIRSYAWSKISGPSGYTIANPASASTNISDLVQGAYVFSLQVTDNAGGVASATVTVNVNAAPVPVNQPPVANAGNDISLTLPVNYTTLDGSGSSDPDGGISSYAWSKTSGPEAYSIINGGAASTSLNNLTQGVYIFTLKVTDNAGATSSASVTVDVNAAFAPPPPVNLAPVVNAGGNSIITLPVNAVTLNGSASIDPDGSISTYAWSKVSGPDAYSIGNAAVATTAVTNLVQGIYVFNLTVTDNAGAMATSSVTITVNRQPNAAPAAKPGPDLTITLPTNSVMLDGSTSADVDGSISTYSWTKTSGPGAVTIVNSNTAVASVIGLQEGQYAFALTVTDNEGASASNQVVVTVLPQPNKAPVANAGNDSSVALPVSSITLSGIRSMDPDGSISDYKWKQISGPSTGIFSGASAVTTQVTGLVEGDYLFELQVTDNQGATASATVKVSVLNNFRFIQYFRLYPNPAINTVSFQFIDDKTGKLMVAVYDVNGRLVLNEEVSKDQSLITRELNVSKLKPGMYYLELRQGDGTKLIRPFVKE